MKKTSRVVLLLLLLPLCVHASELVALYGVCANSCGKLTAAYEEGPPSIGVQHEGRIYSAKSNLYAQWLSGFFSAHNTLSKENLFDGIDIEGLIAWVRNYCQENPLSLVNAAAYAATRESYKRKQH